MAKVFCLRIHEPGKKPCHEKDIGQYTQRKQHNRQEPFVGVDGTKQPMCQQHQYRCKHYKQYDVFDFHFLETAPAKTGAAQTNRRKTYHY